MPEVDFLIRFAVAGYADFIGVHHHDKIPAIRLRRILTFPLPHDGPCNGRRQPAQNLVFGIDQMPMSRDMRGCRVKCFHFLISAAGKRTIRGVGRWDYTMKERRTVKTLNIVKIFGIERNFDIRLLSKTLYIFIVPFLPLFLVQITG